MYRRRLAAFGCLTALGCDRRWYASHTHNAAHARENRPTRISSAEKSPSSVRVLANVIPQMTITTAAVAQALKPERIAQTIQEIPPHPNNRPHPIDSGKNNDNLLSTKGALASPWSFPGSVARASCALYIDTAVIVEE